VADQTSSKLPTNTQVRTTALAQKHHVTFKTDGSPYSEKFNDIYFDTNSGYQQSEQVFIKANNIEQQLLQAKKHFIIAETGFGTGLNFLLTLQAYQKAQVTAQQQNKKLADLTFISVEKYPLTKHLLAKSLTILPELNFLAEQLLI